jgi:Domain of unknown function (DUF4383)
LVVFVYGMVVSQRPEANFVPVNPAGNILYLWVGAAMVLLGTTLSRRVLITPGRQL